MRILLDQGTPVPLRQHLPHHIVRTAFQEGWATLANGELLTAEEADGFDVFVTADKSLRYQQDLSKRRIAVVVISHAQWPALEPHVQLVVAAVDRAVGDPVPRRSGRSEEVIRPFAELSPYSGRRPPTCSKARSAISGRRLGRC